MSSTTVVLLLAAAAVVAAAGSELSVPEGAASLAFVFDVTGSMYDDLLQVMDGASKILETARARDAQPLYNYVLVPFRDPEIGPTLVTEDEEVFENELRYLDVHGGGDCPEMAIGAIHQALAVSLPRSYIYVFTDARAKDYKDTDKVLELVQQKESQVVFVMTGDCGDPQHEGYKAFEKIASTSSGQVFLLKKSQVNEVLNFVKIAINARKVNLFALDKSAGGTYRMRLPIDLELQEFTVSLSGDRPSIVIRDPNGKVIAGDSYIELLRLKNALIVNVKNPIPGEWTVDLSSTSAHTVRSTGISGLDFTYRFGVLPGDSYATAFQRPVQGLLAYPFINGTGFKSGIAITRIELLDLEGSTLLDVALTHQPQGGRTMYTGIGFIPPRGYFNLRVHGTDQSGHPFIRNSKGAVSALVPQLPGVSAPAKVNAQHGSAVKVVCHVESLLPYSVVWLRDGAEISEVEHYSQTASLALEIPAAGLSHKGKYVCNATSEVGSSLAETVIEVSDPPPKIAPAQNVTVAPGSDAVLDCVVSSTTPATVRWLRPAASGGRFIELPASMRLVNGSLYVRRVDVNAEGWYVCQAENVGGNSSSRVYLKVGAAPIVGVVPSKVSFTAGHNVTLRCTSQAFPPADITWSRSGRPVVATARAVIRGGLLSLFNLRRDDEGVYECHATNLAGSASANADVTYIERPRISLDQQTVLVAIGDSAALLCPSSGTPRPRITWFKGDTEVTASSAYIRVSSSGELIVINSRLTDAGVYRCVATNEAGADSAEVTLEVGTPAVIVQAPRSVQVDIGNNATLTCRADGYPAPRVHWRKGDVAIPALSAEEPRTATAPISARQLPDGSLFVPDIGKTDEGSYTCKVENRFGVQEASASVVVTGIVQPVVAFLSPLIEVTKGEDLRLSCVVLVGNPKPRITWLRDGAVLRPVRGSIEIDSTTGSLVVYNINTGGEGEYVCHASNIAGNATMLTRVDVRVPPTIEGSGSDHHVVTQLGESVKLTCNFSGDPLPSVYWLKDGNRVPISNPHYHLTADGTLEIFGVTTDDTAAYTCIAQNPVGDVSKHYSLFVRVPPKISREQEKDITVVAGDTLLISCEVTAVPPPTILWKHNGREVDARNVKAGYTRLSNGAFRIEKVGVNESGTWECIATNDVGTTSKVVNVRVNVPPTIMTFGPDEYTVVRGNGVTLQCESVGQPMPLVKWQKNGAFLTTQDLAMGFSILANGALKIDRAKVEDDGLYTCVASNDAGTVQRTIRLIVHEPPSFPTSFVPKDISVIQGRSSYMYCPVQGFPKPKVTWFKDGRELTGNELGIRLHPDNSLEIAAAEPQDAGTYECRASNPAGDIGLSITFKVYLPPRPNAGITAGQEIKVIVNGTFTLSCPVNAIPPPTITWYKDKTGELTSDGTRVAIGEQGTTLQVTNVQLTDAGKYTCRAENLAGQTEMLYSVTVVAPPSILDPPSSSQRELEVVEGRSIVIECAAQGTPAPHVRWFKDNREIHFQAVDDLIVLDSGRRLLINNPVVANEGVYKCVATNEVGQSDREFHLRVYVPPLIEQADEVSAPEVIRGNSLRLECPARGKPAPAITWFKEDTPINASDAGYRILEEGRVLEVRDANPKDSGRYSCRAENTAGIAEKQFVVTLLIRPHIDSSVIDLNVSVIVNRTVVLNCPVDGYPTPDIWWLKNGELLDTTRGNVELLQGGRQLRIHHAQVLDTAAYRCLAANKAGEDHIDYYVNVYVPSSIDLVGVVTNPKVVRGNQLVVDCPAQGVPPPVIQWFRNGQLINFASETHLSVEAAGRRLVITNASVEHSTVYTCRAINVAGTADISISIHVLVPPSIQDSQGVTQLSVVVNNSIEITCDAGGIPKPTVRWLSNGQALDTSLPHWSLAESGYKLKLTRAQLMHTARYTCVAENEAGKAEKDFDLSVHVPPFIDDSNIDLSLRVIRGRNMLMECPAQGVPFPEITWRKNGQPIADDRISIAAGGRQLELVGADEEHTAEYTCEASNVAGRARIQFDLQVLIPPSIDESNVVTNPKVILNRTVTIECPVVGFPDPTVTFFKDGRPLVADEYLNIYEHDKKVVIRHAQIIHTGRYTCIAENEAGELRQNYDLEVLVPPRVIRNGLERTVSTIQNRTAIISCPVDGIPKPSITWLKGRTPLVDWPMPNKRLLNNDQRLEISNAQPSDADEYSCRVSNPAGRDRETFNLNVHIPPSVEGQRQPPTELSVIVKQAFSLSCDAQGTPKPKISWFKDGLAVEGNSHYRISADGEILDVLVTEVDDRGRYTCRASNVAGQTEKHFYVTVYVPSSIANSSSVVNMAVIINSPAELPCPAIGTPEPSIVWFKDGTAIDPRASPNHRPVNGGRVLQIFDAQLLDIGTYMCYAFNPAGNATKTFVVEVLVPPSIEDGDTFVGATVNTRTLLLCETIGLPQPKVSWFKNGSPLALTSLSYRMLQSGTLEFASVSNEDTGNYTCTAESRAGKVSRDISLFVQVPPQIENINQKVNVKIGDNVDLPCNVTGIPRPKLTWQRGTSIISDLAGVRSVLPNGSLRLINAQPRDAGSYVCVAQNRAGTSVAQIKLDVLVPPTIDESPRLVTVVRGREIQLPCTSKGIPRPDVTWFKDGEALSPTTTDFRYRLLQDGRLAIPMSRSDDAGVYTCEAENSAGKAAASTQVVVHVPASIVPSERSYTVVQGNSITLTCDVDGFPKPIVRWQHDFVDLLASNRFTVLPNGHLKISGVQAGDGGSFTCLASNEAGRDSAEVTLRVQVPPTFKVVPSPREVTAGQRIYLECEAVGTPMPVLTWKMNNSVIDSPPSTAGRSWLLIENARKSDEGTYHCVAENAAGSRRVVAPVTVKVPPRIVVAPGNTIVRVAERVVLQCSVGGSPAPQIIWTKNGRPVQLSNRIQQLANGSLIIYDSNNEDMGEYKCSASNEAGTSEVVAYLTIRSPPRFTLEPQDTRVRLGETVALSCSAEGEPQPTIQWRKNNSPLISGETGDRVSVLADGLLRIVAAQQDDSATYACIARNPLGSVLVQAQLIVQVDGSWSAWTNWSACSVTCGGGKQQRSRSCSNPAPANDGRPCDGPAVEVKECSSTGCAVDGVYGPWGPWEPCSTTCGAGEKQRRRLCDSPAPVHGGRPCDGAAIESTPCDDNPECAVNGGWSDWAPWRPCSTTCGEGYQERLRQCSNPRPQHGGRACSGPDVDRRRCHLRECPVHGSWSDWQPWGACSASCGGGVRVRDRDCASPAPQHGGRTCHGVSRQQDYCNSDPCPSKPLVDIVVSSGAQQLGLAIVVHSSLNGGWSDWEAWGECTLPCNGGRRKRFRQCTNPVPAYGGRQCAGVSEDVGPCNEQPCADGVWTSWSQWSSCSVTCGTGGAQTRQRDCLQSPSSAGPSCIGERSQTQTCSAAAPCRAPPPSRALGNVIGSINGHELDLSRLLVTFRQPGRGGPYAGVFVTGELSNVSSVIGPHMRLLASLLTPFYWTMAAEEAGSANGYTLTSGVFQREVQVEFATGEIVRMSHMARGVDERGELQVDVIVNGNLPAFASDATVVVDPYTEYYVQTGPGRIYAFSSRMFRVNQHTLPYAWNHSISYEAARGAMPFLVQQLVTRNVHASYDTRGRIVRFAMEAVMQPAELNGGAVCPPGFNHDVTSTGTYCIDTDECTRLKPCSHGCANTQGGFKCACPAGLTLDISGRTCQDIDECLGGIARCHSSQDCINTPGSYKCVARCDPGYKLSPDGMACVDINECVESERPVCEHRCVNTNGGYQCRCNYGYRIYGRSKCIDVDECSWAVPPCSHQCQNTPGSYECSCPRGLQLGSSGQCADIDECAENMHNCRADEDCINQPGGAEGLFKCVKRCPAGHEKNALGACVDIDECERGSHGCGFSQICQNLNGSYACTCGRGYRTDGPGKPCIDVNECLVPGQCQHECQNVPGSFRCLCPPGFKLHSNGRTCIDIDECSERNIDCGPNKMCFNQRGSYECVDVSCPRDYERLPSGSCVLPCNKRPDVTCPPGAFYADTIEFHMLAVPSGIPARQDLIRLAAYNQYHLHLKDTTFTIIENDPNVPFEIRLEDGRGIVYPLKPMQENRTYVIKVTARSFDANIGGGAITGGLSRRSVQYQTTFLIYISVSAYPF